VFSPSRRSSKNPSITPAAAKGPTPTSAPTPKAHNLTLVWVGLCGLCVAGLLMALVEASAGAGAILSSGSSLDGAAPAVDPEVEGTKVKAQQRAQTKRRVRTQPAADKVAEPVKDAKLAKDGDPAAQKRKRAADARIKALSERLRKEREERARKRARQRSGGGRGGKGK